MPPTISLGRILIFRDKSRYASLGADADSPAMVTRVHNPNLANLAVFHDGYASVSPYTSVRVYETEAIGQASGDHWFAYWPPRLEPVPVPA